MSSVNANLIPGYILDDLRERLKMEVETEEAFLARLSRKTAEELFDEYCHWNGLIDWGPQLRGVLSELREAKSE